MPADNVTPVRLEAFSDGVIAIIITIMVLELKVPHGPEPAALLEQWPLFFAYALSFLQVGIYWINHHHLFKTAKHISPAILWWNLLLLFALSLVPFATAYMGENYFAVFPTAVYACAMLLPALSFERLHQVLIGTHESDAAVSRGALKKGHIALALYAAAIPLAYVSPWISLALIIAVAAMYFMPIRYF